MRIRSEDAKSFAQNVFWLWNLLEIRSAQSLYYYIRHPSYCALYHAARKLTIQIFAGREPTRASTEHELDKVQQPADIAEKVILLIITLFSKIICSYQNNWSHTVRCPEGHMVMLSVSQPVLKCKHGLVSIILPPPPPTAKIKKMAFQIISKINLSSFTNQKFKLSQCFF